MTVNESDALSDYLYFGNCFKLCFFMYVYIIFPQKCAYLHIQDHFVQNFYWGFYYSSLSSCSFDRENVLQCINDLKRPIPFIQINLIYSESF